MGSEFYFEIFRMVSALALVLGVLFVLVYVAKKTLWKGVAAGGVPIRVLGQRSLGPKKSLVVVEVDGRRMVLGVTSDRITLLEKTGAAEEVSLPVSEGTDSKFFPRILSSLMDRRTGEQGR